MTAKEFWEEDPRLIVSYIKKREIEQTETNYKAWLFGLYTYKALSVVITSAFSKKNSLKETYFEKPLEELDGGYAQKVRTQKEKKDEIYRESVNYWAKFGKRGK